MSYRNQQIRKTSATVYTKLAVGFVTAWLCLLLMSPVIFLNPWPDVVLVTDFASYWTGALLLRGGEGEAMYDAERQYALQLELRRTLATSEEIRNDAGYNPYPNPPPLALLYLPLTYLPISTAYLLWWGLSLASFLAAIAIPLRGQPMARSKGAMLLTFGAVSSTLFEGQPYGLMLLSFSVGLMLLRAGHPFSGGVALGLLFLKPQYAVLLPIVFLLKRRWRELAGMSAPGLLILAGSLVLVGPRGLIGFVELLRRIGDYSFTPVSPYAMVNWRAVAYRLFPGLDPGGGALLVLVLGALTVAAGLFLWRGIWNPGDAAFAVRVLGVMAASIVASPHSHIHGAVFLLAPVALALGGGATISSRLPHLTWLLLAGYGLVSVAWWVATVRWLLVPYLILLLAYLLYATRAGHEPSTLEALQGQEV